MNSKNDGSTKNADERQQATCESGTQCHQQDWNEGASEGNTVSPPNYEVACERIRFLLFTEDSRLEEPTRSLRRIVENLDDVDAILKAVNK